MLAWLAADFLAALLFLGVGYRLVTVPVLPAWVPRALLWPLRHPSRRALRLQGVSSLCTGGCFALVPAVMAHPIPAAVSVLVVVWAASAVSWALSLWASFQPEPGGARP